MTTTPDTHAGARTAERLLTELRGEIARADSKASVLVARAISPRSSG